MRAKAKVSPKSNSNKVRAKAKASLKEEKEMLAKAKVSLKEEKEMRAKAKASLKEEKEMRAKAKGDGKGKGKLEGGKGHGKGKGKPAGGKGMGEDEPDGGKGESMDEIYTAIAAAATGVSLPECMICYSYVWDLRTPSGTQPSNMLELSDSCILVPCSHGPCHIECLREWLQKSGSGGTCPTCRTHIDTEMVALVLAGGSECLIKYRINLDGSGSRGSSGPGGGSRSGGSSGPDGVSGSGGSSGPGGGSAGSGGSGSGGPDPGGPDPGGPLGGEHSTDEPPSGETPGATATPVVAAETKKMPKSMTRIRGKPPEVPSSWTS